MANTFNGIGTTFYGQCAFEQDDSFITTKWFVLGMPSLVKFAWVAVAAFIPLGLRAFAKWRQGHE
ncbi:hypothetical protein ACDW_01480 [Acidovorax sp. DW039]|uniref:hypothetical protein n=1 Tax=Acidovorax sp. DW039 TaxID=3095606 RepID=UPI00309046AB|nr:hypothetical protein ACDW_01480 [Acidovorax sp. DW039]